MGGNLDELLGDLAHAPIDHGLDGLEDAVMAGVAQRRAARRALHALGPAQAAAVAVSVAIGLAAGGAVGLGARPSAPPAMLSTALAPSTLLVASR